MKITALRRLLVRAVERNWLFVKVETDAGLHGWGEASLELKERTVAQAVRDLEPHLLRDDPTRIEHLRLAFRPGRGPATLGRGSPVSRRLGLGFAYPLPERVDCLVCQFRASRTKKAVNGVTLREGARPLYRIGGSAGRWRPGQDPGKIR
jgi:hypothetical protein